MDSEPFFLVAEDDPDDQLLLQDAIEASCPPELKTRYVWDGVELMDFLQKEVHGPNKPRLVILDLNMPRKDGRAALMEMKADPNLASIPVVVLTTSSIDTDVQYCRLYGAAGYFRKPGSMMELQEIVVGLCTDYLV